MVAQLSRDYIRTRPGKLWSRLLSYALVEGRPVTTRGRWINPVVFGLFRIERLLPPMRKVRTPVFILGSGRSGTTALGITLSMHADVGFLNEPKALWHAIHPEEDVIGNYSDGAARYRLGAEDATPARAEAARRLFGAALLLSGSARVVDKYPELVFRVPFVKGLFPDAKFILLVRDGASTVASIVNWSNRHRRMIGEQVHDWWGVNNRKWKLMCDQLVPGEPLFSQRAEVIKNFMRDADMAAVEWVITMREGMRQHRSYPEDLTVVRFEDLTADPRRVLRELADFCQLRSDPTFLDFGVRALRPQPLSVPPAIDPTLRDAFAAVMHELQY